MLSSEPMISVGIIDHAYEVKGELLGQFKNSKNEIMEGRFFVRIDNNEVVVYDSDKNELYRGKETNYTPTDAGEISLDDVAFGINFHWERKERQIFEGAIRFIANNNTLVVINEIPLEKYLASVISSEMSGKAPLEFLKAQAITSRSWLAAMLEMKKDNLLKKKTLHVPPRSSDESIQWYDREEHELYDVCADDHCQRYHGTTKIITDTVLEAIRQTRGIFICYQNKICDARFHKACGGLTEQYENVWDDKAVPYLTTVSCSEKEYHLTSEHDTLQWINTSPDAYCNTLDKNILLQILPAFDLETTEFFRWKVEYEQKTLSDIIRKKSGIDFGTIQDLIPMQRGSSGRIVKLKIIGSNKSVIVGKELEIRKWLSASHLYSSAFVVEKESSRFILRGAGWGHGVGLCQIGGAVMATEGKKAEEIVKHYYKKSELLKLY